MSEKLPNMLESTIAKIREMVDSNTVVGEPIQTVDGVTIIPVSKISIGLGGGGSDFVSSKAPAQNPFGGGVGAGVKVTLYITPVYYAYMEDFSRWLTRRFGQRFEANRAARAEHEKEEGSHAG